MVKIRSSQNGDVVRHICKLPSSAILILATDSKAEGTELGMGGTGGCGDLNVGNDLVEGVNREGRVV